MMVLGSQELLLVLGRDALTIELRGIKLHDGIVRGRGGWDTRCFHGVALRLEVARLLGGFGLTDGSWLMSRTSLLRFFW